MANMNELSSRLLKRFKDVPGVDLEDTDGWIELAMNEHGFERQEDVPVEYISLIMLYAEADGTSQVSLRTAYFFMYSDKDETVDKTKVADHYRKLAEVLWERYKAKKTEGVEEFGGSRFAVMTRADR